MFRFPWFSECFFSLLGLLMQGQTFSLVLCGAWQFPEELAGCFVDLLSWSCSMSSSLGDCRKQTPGAPLSPSMSHDALAMGLHSADTYLAAVDCVGSKPPPHTHPTPTLPPIKALCSAPSTPGTALVVGSSAVSGGQSQPH